MNNENIIEINGEKYIKLNANPDDDDILAPGNQVIIRTVTYHHVGLVVSVTDKELLLEKASWVADSGRWHVALKNGELNEVEYSGKTGVRLDAVVDYFPWHHPLPTASK